MKKIAWFLAFVILLVMPRTILSQDGKHGDKAVVGRNFPKMEAGPDVSFPRSVYYGEESFRYSVSWFGVNGGELFMRVARLDQDDERLLMAVTVRSTGLLGVLYPVDDYFTTTISARSCLPFRYEMIQREGRRKNKKVTLYDQIHGRVSYSKNNDAPQLYEVAGPVHNEFSAFLFLRVLSFASDANPVVPTFADRKRHLVAVICSGSEKMWTIFGLKETLKVSPHLTFKGLYQKVGDPHIWMLDDSSRIPVKILAKILIGSLTAELIEYRGPAGHFISERE